VATRHQSFGGLVDIVLLVQFESAQTAKGPMARWTGDAHLDHRVLCLAVLEEGRMRVEDRATLFALLGIPLF
jgi:hypothetical protein